MKTTITKRAIDQLKVGQSIADDEVRGLGARRLPSGAVTYYFRYEQAGQRQFAKLGVNIAPDEARRAAQKLRGAVAGGRDPVVEKKVTKARATKTVNAVLDQHIVLDLEARKLRSVEATKKTFDRLVRPAIGAISIYDLKRSDIVALLDKIASERGPTMADAVLAHLRSAFNWYAGRDDNFRSPIGPRMRRMSAKERQRDRVLDEQEICDVWNALPQLKLGREVPSHFPRYIRVLMLTGLRRYEVAGAHRDEITGKRWLIPKERMKGKLDHLVPLTPMITQLLGDGGGYLFSSDGRRPFSGFGRAKAALDRCIAELRMAEGRKPMPRWTFHDLRRTARTIMSRCGSSDIAERLLAHVMPGVRGVYDKYAYEDEKREMLLRLEAHILGVVNPKGNVVRLSRGSAERPVAPTARRLAR